MSASSSAAATPSIALAILDPTLRDYVSRILTPHYAIAKAGAERAADLRLCDLAAFGQELESVPEAPIIVIAVEASDERLTKALTDGASDWLVAPFSDRNLLSRVSMQLELARLRAAAAASVERERIHAALAEAKRQKDALYRLTDQLQRATGAHDIYDASLDAILSGLRCDRASILLYDDENIMRFVAWRELSGEYRQVAEGHSPWKPEEKNAAPLGIEDVEQVELDATLKQRILLEGIRAAAFIPLVCEGRLIGKFMAYFNVPHAFSEGEMALSLTIARQLAFALQRHRSEQALRESEERLRLATQSGKIGLWEWDIAHDRVIWTESLYRIHGVRSEEFQPTVENFVTLVHAEDRGFVANALKRSLEQNAPYELMFRIVTPNNDIVWVFTNAVILRQDGKPVRMVGSVTDVSDIKQAEENVRAVQLELKRADRRKDEFIAMLAHELRNPLAPIANAVHLLRRQKDADLIQVEAREIIDRQVRRLTRLVDDLLDVSRITSGRVQLHRERVAIDSVIERAVEIVRPLIEQECHELRINLTREPIWVYADTTRLEQVIVNLLNNAAKYTNPGGRIELTSTLEEGLAVLRVRDTGIGIDAQLLPHVFDLFTQAERTLDRSRGGLGIGLSLVQRLIQMHGGAVEVASVAGQGSEFTVRLPAIPSPEFEGAPLQVARRRDLAVRPLRVLVVDDNIDAAQSLSMLLEAAGHSIKLSFDGLAAIDAAREHRPHVVFLDIGLPKLNGYDVAKRLRTEPTLKSTLIVAMTGYGQPDDLARSDAAGFDHHLVKPADAFRVEQLLGERARAAVD